MYQKLKFGKILSILFQVPNILTYFSIFRNISKSILLNFNRGLSTFESSMSKIIILLDATRAFFIQNTVNVFANCHHAPVANENIDFVMSICSNLQEIAFRFPSVYKKMLVATTSSR